MRLCHHYYCYFFIIIFIINSIIIIIYFGSSATRYHRRHHHDRLAMEFFATPPPHASTRWRALRCPDAPGGSSAALPPPAPPLTLRTSDDHAWPLVPGVYGPLGPIPHDMSLAPLADDDARGSRTPSSSCHEGDELAKDVVAKLKRHPLCQNAWFDSSRGSFKILRTDQKYFEVGIPDVQKLHSSIPVIQTYAKALGFLNAETNQETNAKACEAPRDEETKQE